jgi:hypothetical protein
MATRREEKERRRAERVEAERREAEAARRRLVLGYVAAAILTGAVVAGIVVLVAGGGSGGGSGEDFPDAAHINLETGSDHGVAPDGRTGTTPPPIEQADLQKAADLAGCELRLNLPDEGNNHVSSTNVQYGTNPPTSGDHNPSPQADGAYAETPPLENAVHSLEHGRIEIQYSPDLPGRDRLELKGLFDESPGAMLLFPNDDMPYEVAATAWTQLLGCDRYDGGTTIDAIRAFRDVYRGQGPESVAFTP